ncbi:MAG: amidohydrolase [Woeseia sp.]
MQTKHSKSRNDLRLPVTGVVCLLLLTGCAEKASDPNDPDILLINGNVITMNGSASIVEAISIRGEKIVALGESKKIRKFAGPETEIIDLNDLTVTPGLIDVHNHFAWGALDERLSLNLAYPGVTSIGDVQASIEEAVQTRGPDEWIIGSKWDAGKLAEGRDMTRADLDAVAPENPVWLLHTSAHYGVANSRALALANVTKDTPDPDGGVIARDDDGNPTGILADQAMNLVFDITPAYTTGDFAEAIAHQVRGLNAEGITTIKDPEIDRRHWDAYRQVQSHGELTVRVFALWGRTDTLDEAKELLARIAPFTNPRKGLHDDQVISGGVKIYIDGSGTARTAWMYDEWNKNFTETDEGNYGLTYVEPDVLFEQIRLFHKAGLHVGAHAIGDRAIDFTMDAYDKILDETPTYGLRHSIIHCNIPTDHALDLMYKLQNSYDAAYPEVQPAFLWWIGDAYAANFGPDRNPRVLPLKTFLDRGIGWAASSDYDVSPFPPRYGLWAAIARQTLFGTHGKFPYGIEESISVQDALKSYTTSAARQVFLEDKIGSIETGKYADIVVWDRDPYSVSTAAIKDLKALLTVFNGTIVHRDEALD